MNLIKTASLILLLGAATVGGTLFSYSSFTLRGIRSLPGAQAVPAMQAVNLAANRSGGFVLILMGTALGSLVIGVVSAVRHTPGWGSRVVGASLYLATVLITAAFNVPRNDVLAALDPSSPDVAAAWAVFVGPWVMGNHVRVLTCLGAVVAFGISLTAVDPSAG